MGRAFAVAALLIAASTVLFAQDARSYTALVERYAGGDAAGAVSEIARWPPSRVDTALDEWLRARSTAELHSAVMLHTDLAYVLLIGSRTSPWKLQARYADRLLRASVVQDRTGASTQAFAIRWHAFMASMYTAWGLTDAASQVVLEGLTEFPRAAELYVARGEIQEMRANAPLAPPSSTISVQTGRMLRAAAADFQQAADLDDTLAAAYLHRGRVDTLLDDGRAARDLETALARARDDGVRYLAHLFLGAIAEKQNDFETARREYETARTLGRFQTSAVALSRAEGALGHADRARELAREFAARGTPPDDPWWDYRLGFDAQLLAWLRREARHE